MKSERFTTRLLILSQEVPDKDARETKKNNAIGVEVTV